jgi:hypothetical protein
MGCCEYYEHATKIRQENIFSLFSQHFFASNRKRLQAFARSATTFASIHKGFGGGWRISDKLKHLKGVYMQFATHALCSRFILKAFASIRKAFTSIRKIRKGHS